MKEKERLETTIAVNNKSLNELKSILDVDQQEEEAGDAEFAELLSLALASGNARAQMLANSLQLKNVKVEVFDVDESLEEFGLEEMEDEEGAHQDPYLGGDASWDSLPAGQPVVGAVGSCKSVTAKNPAGSFVGFECQADNRQVQQGEIFEGLWSCQARCDSGHGAVGVSSGWGGGRRVLAADVTLEADGFVVDAQVDGVGRADCLPIVLVVAVVVLQVVFWVLTQFAVVVEIVLEGASSPTSSSKFVPSMLTRCWTG